MSNLYVFHTSEQVVDYLVAARHAGMTCNTAQESIVDAAGAKHYVRAIDCQDDLDALMGLVFDNIYINVGISSPLQWGQNTQSYASFLSSRLNPNAHFGSIEFAKLL